MGGKVSKLPQRWLNSPKLEIHCTEKKVKINLSNSDPYRTRPAVVLRSTAFILLGSQLQNRPASIGNWQLRPRSHLLHQCSGLFFCCHFLSGNYFELPFAYNCVPGRGKLTNEMNGVCFRVYNLGNSRI
ncbi:hypothetical protein Csa_016845 [Cucumis sativus]|uniref:Uncharacterized protein n=1 Tax=Cucumis sativus TaxID=3659 RepID=A0A0A0K6X3_CUCSA|nr:hypothetical protein Csa_016845 [Cucumis sativus]